METTEIRWSWTQPICTTCWNERNPGRLPVAVVEELREPESCVYCNKDTTAGIYIRINPVDAPNPTLTKD